MPTYDPDSLAGRLTRARQWLVLASLAGFTLILVVSRFGQAVFAAPLWRFTVGFGNLVAFGCLGLLVGSLAPARGSARWTTALLAIVVAVIGMLSFWGMVH